MSILFPGFFNLDLGVYNNKKNIKLLLVRQINIEDTALKSFYKNFN